MVLTVFEGENVENIFSNVFQTKEQLNLEN